MSNPLANQDYARNERRFYGEETPPNSAYNRNAANFYGATPACEPKQNLGDQDFQNSVNQFYGNSNPASRGNMAAYDNEYDSNARAFYGVTPRQDELGQQPVDSNSMEGDARKFYGVDSSREGSARPVVNQEDFEADTRNFYGVSRQSNRPEPIGEQYQPPVQAETPPPQQDNQQASNPYGNQGEFSPPDFNQNFNAALNGKPIYKGMGFKDTRGLLG